MELKKPFITQAEYNMLKRRLCLSKQKVKDFLKLRNTFGDVVKVTDEILVYEGVGADKKTNCRTSESSRASLPLESP